MSDNALIKAVGIPTLAVDKAASVFEIERVATMFSKRMHMEDMQPVLDAFNEMREAFDALNEYGHARANYSALEAGMLAKMHKRGWLTNLRGPGSRIRKQAGEWLAKLDGDKYEEAIKCILEKGATAYTLYNAYVKTREHMERVHDAISDKHEELATYSNVGRVVVSDKSCYGETGAAINDSERIALRKRGAVGIGDGVYVNPETHQNDIMQAIGIRRENIARCIIRLRELCDMVPTSDFESELGKAMADAGQTIAVFDLAREKASELTPSKQDVSSLLREANASMLAARSLVNGTSIVIPDKAINALSETVELLRKQE